MRHLRRHRRLGGLRRRLAAVACSLLATLSVVHGADAQGRRGGRGRGGVPETMPPGGVRLDPQEQALRREIRQRFDDVVKKQLGLSDDLQRRLQQTNQKFNRQRNDVNKDEREARLGLRALLEDTTASPDPAKVDQYLQRMVDARRKQADILDAEQKELATFLNPVQRAKYLGLREQLRQRVSALQQAARGRGEPPPPPPA